MPRPFTRTPQLEIDSADLQLYVKTPLLRGHKWTKSSITQLILMSAKLHQWRTEFERDIKKLLGKDDE